MSRQLYCSLFYIYTYLNINYLNGIYLIIKLRYGDYGKKAGLFIKKLRFVSFILCFLYPCTIFLATCDYICAFIFLTLCLQICKTINDFAQWYTNQSWNFWARFTTSTWFGFCLSRNPHLYLQKIALAATPLANMSNCLFATALTVSQMVCIRIFTNH